MHWANRCYVRISHGYGASGPEFSIERNLHSHVEFRVIFFHFAGAMFGAKLFDTVITKSVRLEESPAYKESIFTFAPQSSGAVEYEKLCKEVMSRV